jgi:hypothetical protein
MFNGKILAVCMVFSLVSGFTSAFQIFSYVILRHYLDPLEINFVVTMISLFSFFVNSFVFFVILYSLCRRGFMENIASIVISLIVGTIVGHWIGGLMGASFTFLLSPEDFVANQSSFLIIEPSVYMLVIVLTEFGACSAAYVAGRWRQVVPRISISKERPFGITLIVLLYALLGVAATILAGLMLGFFYSAVSVETILADPLVLAGTITLIVVAVLLQFAIAYGLYNGRRWGWLLSFIFTLLGVFSSINSLIFAFSFNLWLIVRIALLLLGIFITIYLLDPHVRIFSGMVNPTSETAGKPAMPEPESRG